MNLSGENSSRRAANAKALAAFGVAELSDNGRGRYRVVREGGAVTVFTIGYERRDGEELIALLLDAGVDHLADVRDKPRSRKPDFRAGALKARCEDAGIEYGAWVALGSTEAQRQRLHESGDLARFHRTFRAYAKRSLDEPLCQLAKVAKKKSIALLCYERSHEECHRSVVADLLADRLSASITAIV